MASELNVLWGAHQRLVAMYRANPNFQAPAMLGIADVREQPYQGGGRLFELRLPGRLTCRVLMEGNYVGVQMFYKRAPNKQTSKRMSVYQIRWLIRHAFQHTPNVGENIWLVEYEGTWRAPE